MNPFKERWGITSNVQMLLIFLVFSITGSSSLLVVKPILRFLGITKTNLPLALYYLLYIPISFTSFQIMLVAYGWLLGQFHFFWEMEKKMIRRIGLGRFLKDQ